MDVQNTEHVQQCKFTLGITVILGNMTTMVLKIIVQLFAKQKHQKFKYTNVGCIIVNRFFFITDNIDKDILKER